MNILFNQTFVGDNSTRYVQEAIGSGQLSGVNRYDQTPSYSSRCRQLLAEKYKLDPKTLFLTTSCTHALEMAAILINLEPGDEVIIPSYTFVSTANAFALRGAKIIMADSCPTNDPNLDLNELEKLITPRTKAIVPVHYGGTSCDLTRLQQIAQTYQLIIIEDAAHAINARYQNRALGSIGDLGTISFHDTKNISCGEGGLLLVNNPKYLARAEIVYEKGTNRSSFLRREIDKYTWVDIGSSFTLSELNAAYLLGQLECLDKVQDQRKLLWERYYHQLLSLDQYKLFLPPRIKQHQTSCYHIFYVVFKIEQDLHQVTKLLKEEGISVATHYIPLHQSPYYLRQQGLISLEHSEKYGTHLLRLPLYYDLTIDVVDHICRLILNYFV